MSKVIEKRLIKEFKDREGFSREELFAFYRLFEPDLNEGTFGWRIYDLKKRDLIKSIQRGCYTISYQPKYRPEPSGNLLKLAKAINGRFEEIKYCIWNSDWINEFSQHQSGKKITLIEIEKDFVESLFYELKDSFRRDFFLNPDEKTIEYYISESRNPVVIKKLVTRSPLVKRVEKRLKISTPALEKMLVDLFVEDKLFYLYQGGELIHIFENAMKSYALNYTKLFSYAKRRDRDQELKEFLSNHLGHLTKETIE